MLALVGCATAFVPLRLPFGATVDRVPSGPLCGTARLLCLAGPRPTRNSVAARAPPPVAKDEDEESSEEELKDELFDLLDTIPERGFEASEDDKADVLEIIAELEERPSPSPSPSPSPFTITLTTHPHHSPLTTHHSTFTQT